MMIINFVKLFNFVEIHFQKVSINIA